MAIDENPSLVFSYWLFYFESLLPVTITAIMTFLVLKDDPGISFAFYAIGVVVPISLVGFGTVLFLTLRTRQVQKSFLTGAFIVTVSQFSAILVNIFLVNAIWQAVRPPCQIQCGNQSILSLLEIGCPLMCLLPGMAATGLASLLGWIVLRLRELQAGQSQVKTEGQSTKSF